MTALQLNILCNKDEREEDDIKVEEQLKDLGIPLSKEAPKVIQEWRTGFVIMEHIEAFYPHGKLKQHTLIHMASNNIITVRESVEELTTLLNKPQDGKCSYNYTANIS